MYVVHMHMYAATVRQSFVFDLQCCCPGLRAYINLLDGDERLGCAGFVAEQVLAGVVVGVGSTHLWIVADFDAGFAVGVEKGLEDAAG